MDKEYLYLSKNIKNENVFIKDASMYLVGYFHGNWSNFDVFYKQILAYAKVNKINLCEKCFDETIFDETSEKNYDNYLTKFMIKIN